MKPKKKKYFTCPDLEPLIQELLALKSNREGAKAALIDKWVTQLDDMRLEMNKLEKFEALTHAVSKKNTGELD